MIKVIKKAKDLKNKQKIWIALGKGIKDVFLPKVIQNT